MQESDDNQLLRQYAQTKSEDAFSQLVAQHLNLVYSAAFRQVNNPCQAEEIAQAVFVILARKAGSLRQEVVLASWLYQTTRLTAANALRTEIRRTRREQEAYMQSLANEPEPDVWTRIAPFLETAMSDLKQKERDAIILRFFQGKSLQEIGRSFGSSENAAKKRIQRGLEKLRDFFAKRKIVLTTAIIAAAVSANSVHAAPAGLSATVTAVAAQGAGASSSTLTLIKGALKIMAWAKLKTTIAIGAIAFLAVGTTAVTLKQISAAQEDDVWRHITAMDSRQLEAAPQTVSIRPAKFGPRSGGGLVSDGHKMMGSAQSVGSLLARAYGVRSTRIVNPAALPEGKYDFIVSVPDGQKEALQAAIKDKFGLVAKAERRETQVWLIRVAKQNAPGLKPSSESPPGRSVNSSFGELNCIDAPIASLMSFLESTFNVPVVDQTGLPGNYDITLQWNKDDQHPTPEMLKPFLLDQLGLEFIPATQSVKMLVVEKVK